MKFNIKDNRQEEIATINGISSINDDAITLAKAVKAGSGFYIKTKEDYGPSIHIESLETAQNMIAAIQKAIELDWIISSKPIKRNIFA